MALITAIRQARGEEWTRTGPGLIVPGIYSSRPGSEVLRTKQEHGRTGIWGSQREASEAALSFAGLAGG